MPSKSKAQARFMAAAARSKEFAKKAGISQSQAQEWHEHDRTLGTKQLPEKTPKPKKDSQ